MSEATVTIPLGEYNRLREIDIKHQELLQYIKTDDNVIVIEAKRYSYECHWVKNAGLRVEHMIENLKQQLKDKNNQLIYWQNKRVPFINFGKKTVKDL
jgi:hypothetical protein